MSAQRTARAGCTRVRQVIVNLPTHPFYLLVNDCSNLSVALALSPIGLLRQDCQRSLQSMGQITGLCQGALHSLLAMIEQGIQVVHQWLYFGGIGSIDSTLPAVAHCEQAISQMSERHQAASHLHKASHQEEHGSNPYE